MSALKPLDHYPREYRDLLLKAVRRGAYTIPHSSATTAKRTRGDLYNYRQVLRGEALRGDVEAARLALLFDGLQFSLEGASLIIFDIEAPTFLREVI